MGQWEFWIITTAILMLISLLIFMVKRQMAKRDQTEKQLIETLDKLEEAISQLKMAMTTQSAACYERHRALDREMKNMHDQITNLNK